MITNSGNSSPSLRKETSCHTRVKKTLDSLPDEILQIGFNIGIDDNMEVAPDSHNRVAFTIEKKIKKKLIEEHDEKKEKGGAKINGNKRRPH
jgi:hypothetical protein